LRAAARVSSVLGKLSSPFTPAHVEAFWWCMSERRTDGSRFTANTHTHTHTHTQRVRRSRKIDGGEGGETGMSLL